MWWLNLIIELATVSIIHVQKIVNIKITIESYDEKATGLFFVDTVYTLWLNIGLLYAVIVSTEPVRCIQQTVILLKNF